MFNLTNVSLIYFLCIILMQGPNVTKNTSLSCSLSKDYVLFAYPIGYNLGVLCVYATHSIIAL